MRKGFRHGIFTRSMLTLSQVGKSFGARTLFEDVSLQVNEGERVGLVGPNGAWKSTLFSLILKKNVPDEGTIVLERGRTLGFLAQETAPIDDETILQLATAVTPEMGKIQKIIFLHETKGEGDEAAYHDALARFDELGGHGLEPKAKKILSGLAFRESDFNREARTMSGGWVMRAHLARLLVAEPDLLMLDEPTNHLDLESLEWFRNYLQGYPGAILMISHDRDFLNQLVDSILDIDHGKLKRYRGNYDDYLEQKAADEVRLLAAFKNQQKEIERLQTFADRFRAKASKASQAQSKLKQIARMDKIEAPVGDDKKIRFNFPQPVRSGLRVISMKGVGHAYGELKVYDSVDFEAQRDDRTVLVGPNGAGKSTLLKLLAGVMPVQKGLRELGHNAKVGYYSQNRVEMLDPKRTVLEEVLSCERPVPDQTARTVLGTFLFRGDDAFKRISVLSGGEKSRLALVKLLLDPPNLLLMDEPTTHLDMASIDALIWALKQFQGTLIFISHDVYFIRALATSVLHVHSGKLMAYAGDYQYYLDKSKATSEKSALTAGEKMPAPSQPQPNQSAEPSKAAPERVVKTKEQKRAEAEARNAKSKMKKEAEVLELRLAQLEMRQGEITRLLEQPERYDEFGGAAALAKELAEVTENVQRTITEWDRLSAAAEAVAPEGAEA